MDGWMGELTIDGWMDWWMDGRTQRRMDNWMMEVWTTKGCME